MGHGVSGDVARPALAPGRRVSVLVATPSLPGHQAMKWPPPTVTVTCVPAVERERAPVTGRRAFAGANPMASVHLC